MKSFTTELYSLTKKNISNNFGLENYDENRFGNYTPNKIKTQKKRIKNHLKLVIYKFFGYDKRINSFVQKYNNGLELLWSHLNEQDKVTLVQLMAYRLLGYKKIKLKTNNDFYWNSLKTCTDLRDLNDSINPNFKHFMLHKMDLNKIGYDINLYYSPIGVMACYVLEQYAYKLDNKKIVSVDKNDIVLDCGGCWGDTALYFAHCVGEHGKVYSFEFIPNNIKIFNTNLSLNPSLKKRIEIVPYPLSDKSDIKTYIKDNGPGSIIKSYPFDEQTGITSTIAIDDFVSRNSISKVDFIKMDIEGSEPSALIGAEKTIRKFKPKLAISIYHSMDDFINIPKWILDLDLGYELYLDHYTIHREETIIFALAKDHT